MCVIGEQTLCCKIQYNTLCFSFSSDCVTQQISQQSALWIIAENNLSSKQKFPILTRLFRKIIFTDEHHFHDFRAYLNSLQVKKLMLGHTQSTLPRMT